MPAIQLTGLTKQFGEVTALSGVDLTVEEGEIFGFLGPNGAGKSTAINILLDFASPTSGTARIFGLDSQTDSIAVRQRVGVLPDGYHLYDRLTGRQHVDFAIRMKKADDDAVAILERVGLGDAVDRKAGGYSRGMKQRLVLGMALVGSPDLLILDEPTNGLDPNGAREFRDIIREEAERGATVFFSSHVLEQVEAVCDRVAILREGSVVAVDTIDGLRSAAATDTNLVLTLDRPFEEGIANVESIEGVERAIADGTVLSVDCDHSSKARIVTALISMGYDVVDITTSETSLEELFVNLTNGDGSTHDAGAEGATATVDGDATVTEVRR
jgi:ABC-2 type transport system ATP-binding protein